MTAPPFRLDVALIGVLTPPPKVVIIRHTTGHTIQVARKVFDTFVEGELSRMALFDGVAAWQLKQIVPLFALEEHAEGESGDHTQGCAPRLTDKSH